MNKILLSIALFVSISAKAAPIQIPASQFPQVSVPSNGMRFIMTYPPGGLSPNQLIASNATISWPNLIRALELALTNTVPSGIGELTNLTIKTANNDWDRFPFVNTNAPGTSNQTIRYDRLVAELQAVINPTFPWVIVTNGSPTAVIQTQFNGNTNNSVISFQPGLPFDVTSQILVTNGGLIEGNGVVLRYADGLTNAMVASRTNFGKNLIIHNLKFDGGTYLNWNDVAYLNLHNTGNTQTPHLYYNLFWTNRTALSLEGSGGIKVYDCSFYGWSGNAAVFMSDVGGAQYGFPKVIFQNNRVYTNFQGVMFCSDALDTKAYAGADLTGVASLPCEYAMADANDIFQNFVGISASPGNCVVHNNYIDENYIALLQVDQNGNGTHGRYNDNSFNHNNYAIFAQFQSAAGMYENNFFGRNGQAADGSGNIVWPNGSASGIHFDFCGGIMFNNNKMSKEWLTFTNGCFGTIAHNTYGGFNYGFMAGPFINDSNLVWGVTGPQTNYDNTVRVYDNFENLAMLSDFSNGKVSSITNVWPPTFYSLQAKTTNEGWQSLSNSVPPHWWFGHYDAVSNVVFDGHIP